MLYIIYISGYSESSNRRTLLPYTSINLPSHACVNEEAFWHSKHIQKILDVATWKRRFKSEFKLSDKEKGDAYWKLCPKVNRQSVDGCAYHCNCI